MGRGEGEAAGLGDGLAMVLESPGLAVAPGDGSRPGTISDGPGWIWTWVAMGEPAACGTESGTRGAPASGDAGGEAGVVGVVAVGVGADGGGGSSQAAASAATSRPTRNCRRGIRTLDVTATDP